MLKTSQRSTPPQIHVHDVNNDLWAHGVTEISKSYPCSEPKCTVYVHPYGFIEIVNETNEPQCSIWLEPSTSTGPPSSFDLETKQVNVGTTSEICTDRDSELRWKGCGNTGCKEEKKLGVCTLVKATCSKTSTPVHAREKVGDTWLR